MTRTIALIVTNFNKKVKEKESETRNRRSKYYKSKNKNNGKNIIRFCKGILFKTRKQSKVQKMERRKRKGGKINGNKKLHMRRMWFRL